MAQPIASFSGLASGIQWHDMIDQIMLLERRPIERIESQITQANSRVTAWKTFKANVQALQDAVKGLADGTSFQRYTTTIRGNPPGEALPATAAASGDAQPGTVRVRTVAVARAEKLGGSSFAARDSVPGIAGELMLNGRAIAISETDTLEQIAGAINAANVGSDAAGASASVLMTPAGEYRLLLTSSATGAEGIALTDDGSGVLAGLGLATPETITAGSDAQLEIDGALYTNASNTFEGILQGVTFTALRESTAELEIDIARDTAAGTGAAKKFVDTMNATGAYVKSQTGSAALAGNGTLRAMHSTLREPMLANVEVGDGVAARLSDIGIEIDRYGEYSLDAKKLEEKLKADPGLVGRLLGGTDGVAKQVSAVAEQLLSVGDGTIDGAVAELEGRLPSLDARIVDLESRLETRRAALVRQFTAMEQALAHAQTQSEWLTSQISAFDKK